MAYNVEVVTGSLRGAGTNSPVNIQLVGKGAEWPEQPLAEGLRPGTKERLRLVAPGGAASERLEGGLKSVRVRLAPQISDTGAGWYLDEVRVTCEESGEVWYFPCRRWFGNSDCGGKCGPTTQELRPRNAQCFSPEEAPAQVPVEAHCGAAIVPHPKKVTNEGARSVVRKEAGHGGEDAYFVRRRGPWLGLGVADGVYMWRKQGIDSGVFSRRLVEACAEAVERGAETPLKMLEHSWGVLREEKTKGSSTACVVLVDTEHGVLQSANVGDSGYALLGQPLDGSGDGSLVVRYRSPHQEHSFGRPYQLGHHEATDGPVDAQLGVSIVRPGDVVVVGSDGLWDNLHDEEIAETVQRKLDMGVGASVKAAGELARELLVEAHEASVSRGRQTPYSLAATEEFDMVYNGGKRDDIAVLVVMFDERRERGKDPKDKKGKDKGTGKPQR